MDLDLKWRRVRLNDAYVNKPENRALRIVFAKQMLDAISKKMIIINYDETVIQQTDPRKFSWGKK